MSLLDTGKDLRRANTLITILLKYGLADVVRRVGLAPLLEQAGRLVRQPVDRELLSMSPPQRLRSALEEMGPTFVKLGQILATRVDLFPQEWIVQFEQLQDSATEIPFEKIEPLINKALGKDHKKYFRSIDPKPIGVASIGQVHKAVTYRGETVVLKVQKPGVRDKINSDIRLLRHLARLAVDNSVEIRRYRPLDLVREFERSLNRELDFTIEARSAERIRKNMRKINWITIPKIHWAWTSSTLCVQELIEGIPARQLEQLDASGVDRKLVAQRGAQAAWKMALEDGFFHADPHPGNFLIMPGSRIGMLDFGMVGKLSNSRKEQIVQIVKAVVTQDGVACARVLSGWSDGMPVKIDAMASDIEDIITQYYGLPLAELDVTSLLNDITALLRNHNLMLPSDIALLLKAIITLEGFGRLMYPTFDVMEAAEPLVKKMVRERYSPTRLARSLSLRALDAVDKLYSQNADPALHSQEQSGLDARHLERLIRQIERSQYRQVQTFLVCTVAIVGAILLGSRIPPTLWGISLLGALLLLGSSVVGVWLMIVARRYLREWE